MLFPALIPLVAIVGGVVTGCALLPEARVLVLTPATLVSLATAVTAHATRRAMCFVIAIGSTFFFASWLLAVDASADAVRPSLLVLAESRTPGMATGSADESAAVLEIEGTLREDATTTPNGVGLVVDVDRASDRDGPHRVSGGVRLTVYGSLAAKEAGRWLAGRRVRATAQLRRPSTFQDPGVPDSRLSLARRGIVLMGSVKSSTLVEMCRTGSWNAELAANCRAVVRRAVAECVGRWGERSAAIVTAILIGDRAGLADEVRERLQQAGTYHVIAISGGNIAILAGLSMLLLRMIGVGSRAACAGTAIALVFYAGLVGGGASVVRATLMGVTYLLARLGDHRGAPLNALAVSVSIILVVSPLAVFDPALALTAGATLGILMGSARFASRLPRTRWLRAPAALGLASISAELALIPVAAFVFSRVTFAGLVLNFAAIPLMALAQVAGMVLLPLWAISGRAGLVAGLVAHLGATGLVESARLVDEAPWLASRVPPPGWLVISAYYLGWMGWVWSSRPVEVAGAHGRSRVLIGRCGLAMAAASALWIVASPSTLMPAASDGWLRVTVLDVGQADATLVRFPDGRALLVDTGGSRGPSPFDVGSRVVAPALWSAGVRRLDWLAITHGDPDHAGGAAAVLRDFRPREVWEGVPVPPDSLLKALRLGAHRVDARWRTVRAGDTMRLGGVEVTVWHPPPPDWERQRVRNDDSVVLELRFGGVSIVLPGDIGREVEATLAPRLALSAFRLLKVPHHGSATSSSAAFLAAVRPDVAVLTVGRGTVIARDVLNRYGDTGTTLLRTDRDGAVMVGTDGVTVEIRTAAGARLGYRVTPPARALSPRRP
jgi:competence protein ComEC